MIIKKYTANNMNEAMTRIRHELGKEAVIISQRKIRKSGFKGLFSPKVIEVTAAIENYANDRLKKVEDKKQDEEFKNSLDNLKKIMNKQIEENKINNDKALEIDEQKYNNYSLKSEVQEMKELLNVVIQNTDKGEIKEDELLTLLKELDIDLDYYEELKTQVDKDNLNESLRNVIHNQIEVVNEELSGNVVLVGPTGVGKTTTIAKLAGKLSLIDKKKVGLITVDTYRIGAVEQLRTYAEIMNIPFKVVITLKEMEEAIQSMSDCDVVLIDTTGRSSKNTMQISELRAFVEKASPKYVNLVISSTTKNKDIKTIVEGFRELGYNSIIITKLDETTTYGSLYNIYKAAEKPVRFITAGQNVPDDINSPTRDGLVRYIFREEDLC